MVVEVIFNVRRLTGGILEKHVKLAIKVTSFLRSSTVRILGWVRIIPLSLTHKKYQ